MKKIIIDKIRVELLSKEIVRLEYNPKKNFLDDNTFIIPTRNEFLDEVEYELIEDNDITIISLDEVKIYVPKLANSLKGIMVKKDDNIIYSYKKIKNSGELPPLNKTPYLFPLMDNPRIIVPPSGYSYQGDFENSGFKIEKNAQDIYLLICKNDFIKLRQLFVNLTGKTEMVRLSTLGSWNSCYFKYDEESAKKMILDYEKYDIPLDNLVIDTDWRAASDRGIGYDIDTKLFPDMKRFFDFAHQHNVEVMFNDHPEPVKGTTSLLDPREVKYREEKLTEHLENGLDYWWYDRNWHTKLITPVKDIACETWGMYLYTDITKHYNQRKNNIDYRRPTIMGNANNIINGKYIKCFDSISHRFPIQWTGDIPSDSMSIKQEIKNIIKCGNNANPYVHPDCGGHIGNPDKELFIRWMQFGSLAPVLRPHCTNSVFKFREPWNYDEETVEIVREYIKMRYRLLPVIYQSSYNSYVTGEPICKQLGFNYPNDEKALVIDNEYMIGNNILVAPVYNSDSIKIPTKNYVTSVKAKYYANTELRGNPIFETETNKLDFHWNNTSPSQNVPIYNFSAVYEMTLCFEDDVELVIESDDGSKVYVDGEIVFSDWKNHPAQKSTVCKLTKNNNHHVKIEYFQGYGDACISLLYKKIYEKPVSKSVYLPNGKWMDAFTGKIYQGGKTYKRVYDYKIMPIYVRLGALIPLAYTSKTTKEQSWDKLIYDFYPCKDFFDKGYLYEDDTQTVAYKHGKMRISEYVTSYDKDSNIIKVNLYKSQGEFDSEKCLNFRNITLKYHLLNEVNKVKKVLINKKEVSFNIHKMNKDVFLFSDLDCSCDSDTLTINFNISVNEDYQIEFVLK
jgi:alpha-glucosidase (family GH31 glycosyl hydrolase)